MKIYLRMSLMREKQAIDEHFEDIEALIIDSHILETFQNATSGYVTRNKLKFIIDPITYRFTTEIIKECTKKRWYDRLVENYKMEDLMRYDGTLNLDKLHPHIRRNSFVKNIINYQDKRISQLSTETESWLTLLSEDNGRFEKKPLNVFPPYFIIESDESLDINIKSIMLAKEHTTNKIYANIPIENELLYDIKFINKLIEKYTSLELDGYFIWITDFNELKQRKSYLTYYEYLFKTFKDNVNDEIQINNMFGGYFSNLLTKKGVMDGFAHGLGFSESKNPYGQGGPAPTRYYVPLIHRMLTIDRAEDILENYEESKCNCPVCEHKEISELSTIELTKHVLNVKVQEKELSETLSLDELIEKMNSDSSGIVESARDSETRKQFNIYTEHLREWSNALS